MVDVDTQATNNKFILNLEDKELKRNLLPSLNTNINQILNDGNKSTTSASKKSTPFKNNSSKVLKDYNYDQLGFNVDVEDKEDKKSISSANSKTLNPISKYIFLIHN